MQMAPRMSACMKELRMNVKEIIQKWLEKNGYDGLFRPDECACENSDLCPCCDGNFDCEPGYKSPCDCGDHDYHIGPDKPSRAEQGARFAAKLDAKLLAGLDANPAKKTRYIAKNGVADYLKLCDLVRNAKNSALDS